MFKINSLIKTLVLFIAGLFVFTACDTGVDDNATGTLQVVMYDAPDEYDQVNVHVERIEIHRQTGGQNSGWQTIGEPDQVYNLLELTNGAQAELGIAELEQGTYRQIRLILGGDNSIVYNNENGETIEEQLTVPSGAQTGVKLNVDLQIEPGVMFTLELDFDAARSVVEAGSQATPKYLLQPVIRTNSVLTSGAIQGMVEPLDVKTNVNVVNGDEKINTYTTDGSGEFLLRGVPDGQYTVYFEPIDTDNGDDYEAMSVDSVSVEIGETTDMGTVGLEETNNDE